MSSTYLLGGIIIGGMVGFVVGQPPLAIAIGAVIGAAIDYWNQRNV